MLLRARRHQLLTYQHLRALNLCLTIRDSEVESHLEGLHCRAFFGSYLGLPRFFPKAVPETRSCIQDIFIGKHVRGKGTKPTQEWIVISRDTGPQSFQRPFEELCKMCLIIVCLRDRTGGNLSTASCFSLDKGCSLVFTSFQLPVICVIRVAGLQESHMVWQRSLGQKVDSTFGAVDIMWDHSWLCN